MEFEAATNKVDSAAILTTPTAIKDVGQIKLEKSTLIK
jgi:hypothetical protein